MKYIMTILLFLILLAVAGQLAFQFLFLLPETHQELGYCRQKHDAMQELYQACERQAKELKLQSYENLRGK